ncbi:ATP-binding protein [Rhizohabitans arisaemae]|uniref:ATP-binding protein n=1 Tax=Rhizohabitans arisaemae TaxID=2720610 RepID=UPI0024B22BDD|nr:ATP-binding protein [Rhizohabitans arisaemae]
MVPVARSFARQFLGDHPATADTELVISELVTLAVTRGTGSDITLRLDRDARRIRVEVSDRAPDDVPLDDHDPGPPTGDFFTDSDGTRRFKVVHSVAARWGHEGIPGRHTLVWAEVGNPAPDPDHPTDGCKDNPHSRIPLYERWRAANSGASSSTDIPDAP